jgi:hypothetical protein
MLVILVILVMLVVLVIVVLVVIVITCSRTIKRIVGVGFIYIYISGAASVRL